MISSNTSKIKLFLCITICIMGFYLISVSRNYINEQVMEMDNQTPVTYDKKSPFINNKKTQWKNEKETSDEKQFESLNILLNDLDRTIIRTIPRETILNEMSTQQIESYKNAINEFSLNNQIQTVCEIGFYSGHNAVMFLTNTAKSVKYISFDVWNQPLYQNAALTWIQGKFPDREINIIRGDPGTTLSLFKEECHIIHIACAHQGLANFTQAGMKHMHRIASENNLLLVDDCVESRSSFLQGVKYLEQNNLAYEFNHYVDSKRSHDNTAHGWYIGKYNKEFEKSVTFLDERLCTPSWNGKNCDRYTALNPCSINSDKCFYNEQSGVLSVSCARWWRAQKEEERTWNNKQRNHARNEEHADSFNYYKSLPDNLGDVIEMGAGPFTQTKTIVKYRKPSINSVTLLEPMAFHYMLHAKYCFFPNGSFGNVPTTLLGIPAEELHNSRQFDTLVMINVIEHVYDALSILESSINLIKEGGLFVWHERLWDTYKGLPNPSNKREFQLHPIRIKSTIAKLLMKMFDPIYESWDTAELRRLKNQGVYFIGRRNKVVARTKIPTHVPCFERPKGKQTIIFFISMSNVTTLQEQVDLADRSENTKRIVLIQTEAMYGKAMAEILENKKIEIMLSYHHFANWKQEIGYYTTPCFIIFPSLTKDMLTGYRTLCVGLKS